MSRTRIELESKDNEQLSPIIDNIISSHGYEYTLYKGTDEQVWNQGIGLAKAPKYIKYYFEGNKLILEGWIGAYGRESELKGVVGALPKNDVKKVLKEIEENVIQFNQNYQNNTIQENNENTINNTNTTPINNTNNYQNNQNTSNNSKSIEQNIANNRQITNKNLNNKMIYYVISIIISVIILLGALSGGLVLRGTNSSGALALFIFVILLFEVYSLFKLYKQKQAFENNINTTNIQQKPNIKKQTPQNNINPQNNIQPPNNIKLEEKPDIIEEVAQNNIPGQNSNMTQDAFKILLENNPNRNNNINNNFNNNINNNNQGNINNVPPMNQSNNYITPNQPPINNNYTNNTSNMGFIKNIQNDEKKKKIFIAIAVVVIIAIVGGLLLSGSSDSYYSSGSYSDVPLTLSITDVILKEDTSTSSTDRYSCSVYGKINGSSSYLGGCTADIEFYDSDNILIQTLPAYTLDTTNSETLLGDYHGDTKIKSVRVIFYDSYYNIINDDTYYVS